jgi:hypothetical protein
MKQGVHVMKPTIRSALLATAFAATVAAALTGASLRGETRETSLAEICATTTWPTIPAYCLEGANVRDVRYVTVASAADSTMAVRFQAAFQ